MEKPSLPTVGVTAFCDFLESPKHYQFKHILNKREEPTAAMKEGTAFHMLTLEPEKFYQTYFTDLMIPEGVAALRTVDDLKEFIESKGQKAKGKKEDLKTMASCLLPADGSVIIYDDWVEMQTANKEFLSKSTWERLHGMRDSFMNHAFVKTHLANGQKEYLIEGELHGFNVRGRVDWFLEFPDRIFCIDVKKTKSAKYLNFRRDIEQRFLYVQAAMYSMLLEKKFKKEVNFLWMACEGSGPMIAEGWCANTALLDAGRSKIESGLSRLKSCLESGSWPGYTDGNIHPMDLPKWTYDEIAQEEMQQMEDEE